MFRKSVISLSLVLFNVFIARGQAEYNYHYQYLPRSGSNQYTLNYALYTVDQLASKFDNTSWRIEFTPDGILLIQQQRIDGKTITDAINTAKLEMAARIDSIASQKASEATAKLKMQLIDAMKDAKLYDEEYKNSIIDATTAKFKVELDAAIENLKKELKTKK